MNGFLFNENINLHVKGRISEKDALRQEKTAKEILKRLQDQPGIILADEVGMGKTFVALAVGASIILNTPGKQVVVMVPGALKDKWPRDFNLFRDKCLSAEQKQLMTYGVADRPVEFLQYLDDPPERRKSFIFLTHGAMSKGVQDSIVKLALMKRAVYKRKNADNVRDSLYKYAGRLIRNNDLADNNEDLWRELIVSDYSDWYKILKRNGKISNEMEQSELKDDDPVPASIIDALEYINTEGIYQALFKIPKRESKNFRENITNARRAINKEIKNLWTECIRRIKFNIPLLIFDEAHHLKNSQTRIASLFQAAESAGDADEISRGPFAGVFSRMLFLTATPFQLGHNELCRVLERFKSINWKDCGGDENKKKYAAELDILGTSLDKAQETALLLDRAWAKLSAVDLHIGDKKFKDVETWWENITDNTGLSGHADEVWLRYQNAKKALSTTETILRKLLIRNSKDKKVADNITGEQIPRRTRMAGAAITNDNPAVTNGLSLDEDKILPFLIAAKAAVSAPDKRAVFAEGLASSYEALLHTSEQRRRRKKNGESETITDTDDEVLIAGVDAVDDSEWYVDQLEQCVKIDMSGHPKIAATIKRVIDLWEKGEKVLVFCHYVQTGRSLRLHISREIEKRILETGVAKLNCSKEHVIETCEKISKNRLEKDSPMKRAYDQEIDEMLNIYGTLAEYREKLKSIIRRFVKTPTFLVRFYPLTPVEEKLFEPENIVKAFDTMDASGLTFRKILTDFFDFLSTKCGDAERNDYINALNSVQKESHMGTDVTESFSSDELQGDKRDEKLLSNVRLINGRCEQETRKKLMLTFNTPFYPEVLICSSVMSEGVDLQLNCRHIIHHDLCWNPSTLEQRTGRVDRIGSKMERCLKPIHVYLPFIAETQDQRMYKVVMEREKWFKIVMGESYPDDFRTTEKQAERLPLPEKIVNELSYKLGI